MTKDQALIIARRIMQRIENDQAIHLDSLAHELILSIHGEISVLEADGVVRFYRDGAQVGSAKRKAAVAITSESRTVAICQSGRTHFYSDTFLGITNNGSKLDRWDE